MERDGTPKVDLSLRTPQARILAALMPDGPADHVIEWPVLNRPRLAKKAGYTTLSGSVTRALNGIHSGSSSGDPHLGLLARGMVEEVVLDIEGVKELCYRATALGVRAYREHIDKRGALPKHREKEACVNKRYRKENDENRESA